MNIKTSLLFVLIFTSLLLQAQVVEDVSVEVGQLNRYNNDCTKLDNAELKVSYQFIYAVADNGKPMQLADTMVLYAGKTNSLYHGYHVEAAIQRGEHFNRNPALQNIEYAETVPYLDFLEKTDNPWGAY